MGGYNLMGRGRWGWGGVNYKADPKRAPFTALRHEELGLLISAREVDLPISLRLTDSIKHLK